MIWNKYKGYANKSQIGFIEDGSSRSLEFCVRIIGGISSKLDVYISGNNDDIQSGRMILFALSCSWRENTRNSSRLPPKIAIANKQTFFAILDSLARLQGRQNGKMACARVRFRIRRPLACDH